MAIVDHMLLYHNDVFNYPPRLRVDVHGLHCRVANSELQMQTDLPQRYVEVIGKVQGADLLDGWAVSFLGDSFDLSSYAEAVKIMQQHPAPFCE
eukprot:m.243916 g.243916  ORF g.243916 m.243916 type:complete len:94 (+) comp10951_c3_seq13:169-450(+)